MLLTGVDEARKWTIWMKANIGPGEALRVKFVLNARKSSHGFLVWKRRRRRKRAGSGALRSLRSTLLHFRFHFFLFSFLFRPSSRKTPFGEQTPRKITPAPLSHCSVAALPSADTLRPAPAVAALLNASGSEDSHRGPYQEVQSSLERHTSECRAASPAARPATSKRLNMLASSPTRGVL